jgi:hypothetical protein
VTELRLDPAASRLLVRTRAAGLFARLAHDLEFQASQISGHARVEGRDWTAELTIPVMGLVVTGTLRDEALDPAGLSPSDRQEVEQKTREQILRGTREVLVRAWGSALDRAEAHVELASGRAQVAAPLTTRELAGGALEVSGACWMSLRSVGVAEVKGPLNAFKIRDEIEIRFAITLRPAP